MADYLPLISRAVSALDPNTRERREAIYARAREALNRQLLSLDPPIAAADLQRERNVLDETIRTVEAGFQPAPPTQAPAEPALKLPPLPSLRPAGTSESAPAPVGAVRAPAPPPPETADPDTAAREEDAPQAEAAAEPVRRPRVDKKRTLVFAPDRKARLAFLAGIPVLIAMGALAYVMRDDPDRYSDKLAPAAPSDQAQTAQQRKSSGRLDGSGAGAPVAGPKPPAAAPAPPPAEQTPILPVAARALFFEEKADDPRGTQSDGQVVWQLETTPAGNGRPAESVVRGTVSVSKANIGFDLVFKRNRDRALPASHTVEVIFRPEAGREGVRAIGPIEARTQETNPGVALKGAMVPVGDNLFLIGLDNTDLAIAKNIEALANEKWFAFQFQMTNNKLGAALIEKGPTGDRIFRQALANWAK